MEKFDNLEKAVNKLIEASENKYEWRVIENQNESHHYFYDTSNEKYDSELKELVDKTKDINFYKFLMHYIFKPSTFAKLVKGIYNMRKPVLDREKKENYIL